MKRKFEKGFTLIELLIVVAVLGALAAVVVPAVSAFIKTANLSAANTEAANVKTAAMSYLADNGCFPNDYTDLLTNTTGGSGSPYDGPMDYLSAPCEGEYVFGTETEINNNVCVDPKDYPTELAKESSVNVVTIAPLNASGGGTPHGDAGIVTGLTWDFKKQSWVRKTTP